VECRDRDVPLARYAASSVNRKCAAGYVIADGALLQRTPAATATRTRGPRAAPWRADAPLRSPSLGQSDQRFGHFHRASGALEIRPFAAPARTTSSGNRTPPRGARANVIVLAPASTMPTYRIVRPASQHTTLSSTFSSSPRPAPATTTLTRQWRNASWLSSAERRADDERLHFCQPGGIEGTASGGCGAFMTPKESRGTAALSGTRSPSGGSRC
jgi:hypothetical protein